MFVEGTPHPFGGIGAGHAEPRQDVAGGKKRSAVTVSERAKRHPGFIEMGDAGARANGGLGRSLRGGRATRR